MLWRENHRSVNYRYSERCRTPRYTHENTRMVMGGHPEAAWGTIQELVRQPHMVLQQLACYDYQTCERPDYDTSVAYRYVTQLKAAVLKTLGMTEDEAHEAPEWQRMPWGINY